MTALAPGETISARFPLEHVCYGMPAWDSAGAGHAVFGDWIEDKRIKVKVEIHVDDPMLTKSISAGLSE